MTHRRLVAALAASLLPLAAAASAPAASAHPGVQVRILGTNSPFSPNGDGVKDRAEIRYRLTRPATVTVLVRRAGRTVATLPRGHQGKGRHTVTWNGKRHGKPVADGRYRVLVRSAGTRTTTAHTTLTVDTKADVIGAGTVAMSSDTVYPRTTLIHDVVVGDLIPDYDILDLAGAGGRENAVQSVRRQVLDASGTVVDSAPLDPATTLAWDSPPSADPCLDTCGRFEWDGHDTQGRRVAPGTYRIRLVRGRDGAGNPRLLAAPVRVRVSTAKLTRDTTSVTLAATDATRLDYVDGYPPLDWMAPADCAVVPSDRFPGGLRFRSAEYGCGYRYFTTSFPVRRTPYDRFTVTMEGGPRTPGATASGTLTAGWRDYDSSSSVAATSTGADVTIWTGSPLVDNTEPVRPMITPPVVWRFDLGNTGPFDIARFTVSYTFYRPVK